MALLGPLLPGAVHPLDFLAEHRDFLLVVNSVTSERRFVATVEVGFASVSPWPRCAHLASALFASQEPKQHRAPARDLGTFSAFRVLLRADSPERVRDDDWTLALVDMLAGDSDFRRHR